MYKLTSDCVNNLTFLTDGPGKCINKILILLIDLRLPILPR